MLRRKTLDGFTEYLSESETEKYKENIRLAALDILEDNADNISERIDAYVRINDSVEKGINLSKIKSELKNILRKRPE